MFGQYYILLHALQLNYVAISGNDNYSTWEALCTSKALFKS